MKIKGIIIFVGLVLLFPIYSNAQSEGPGFRKGPSHGCCCCSCREQKPPHGGPRGPMLTRELIEDLSLTDEQVTKWKENEKAFRTKMEAMRPDRDSEQQLSREEMKEKMDAMMKERDASIKSILTEEQYKKFQGYMERSRPKRPEGTPAERF